MIQAVKGTRDILPEEVGRWHFVEEKARRVFRRYGFREIRTPVFESTDLFARGIGEGTDLVLKEMYTFTDRGDRSLTLRPENTAPVVRAAVENGLFRHGSNRLYYIGPMFRYERPQKGRMRQFHQIGVEAFEPNEPSVDAEIIEMSVAFLTELGITATDLVINSAGCNLPHCRQAYRGLIQEALASHVEELCPDCRRRLRENPLRILDCKAGCRRFLNELPTLLERQGPECRDHFNETRRHLDLLEVQYRVDPQLVRGLDYYVQTTFEITGKSLGAQNALLGGGRYDGLVEALGGPPLGGFGFASGLERLILSLPPGVGEPGPGPDLYIATLGRAADEHAMLIARELRKRGLWVEWDPDPERSLKAKSRRAGQRQARYILFLGEDEIRRGVLTLKRMDGGVQTEIDASDLNRLTREVGDA